MKLFDYWYWKYLLSVQSCLSVNRYFDLITRSLIWSIANEIDKKCGSVKSTQCFAQLKEIYQVINCHPIRPDVIDDREYRSLIIMLSSNQVWLRLSCICWELRLMQDWLPTLKGWWNLVSQSFPINKRLLVVRVCTLSSLQSCTPPTYIPMIHPRLWPLIGQPGLQTVLWLVSPTCLVLFPGESGAAAASLAASVRFPVSAQTWTGLDWTDCCTLDCSDPLSLRTRIFPTGRICFHYFPLFPDLWSETARSDIK